MEKLIKVIKFVLNKKLFFKVFKRLFKVAPSKNTFFQNCFVKKSLT